MYRREHYLMCEVIETGPEGSDPKPWKVANITVAGRHWEKPKTVQYILQGNGEDQVYRDADGIIRGVFVAIVKWDYPDHTSETGLSLVDIPGETFVSGPRAIVPTKIIMSARDTAKQPLKKPGPDREVWVTYYTKAVDQYNRMAEVFDLDPLPLFTPEEAFHSNYRNHAADALEEALVILRQQMLVVLNGPQDSPSTAQRRLDRMLALYLGLRLGQTPEPELLFNWLLKGPTERQENEND